MATIHNTLMGSELHEPKGVASATDGTVATAASGTVSWDIVPTGLLQSEVIVETLADLGTDTGPAYQLATNTVYRMYGTDGVPFVIDKPILWADNTSMESADVNTGVMSITHTSPAIQATGTGVKIKRLQWLGPSNTTGTLFSIDNSSGLIGIELDDFLASTWGNLGTINVGSGFFVLEGWNFNDFSAGLSFTGTGNGTLNVSVGGFFGEIGTTACFDLGVSTFTTINTTMNNNVVTNGSFFSGATSGANIISGGIGFYAQNNVTIVGTGSELVGITSADNGWSFRGNRIQPDSTVFGQIVYTEPSPPTTITLIDATPVIVNPPTSHASGERTDQSADGIIRYTGLRPQKLTIIGKILGQGTSGTVFCDMEIIKNGSTVLYSEGNVEIKATSDFTFILPTFDTLAEENDTYQISLTRVTGTADFDVQFMTILLSRM